MSGYEQKRVGGEFLDGRAAVRATANGRQRGVRVPPAGGRRVGTGTVPLLVLVAVLGVSCAADPQPEADAGAASAAAAPPGPAAASTAPDSTPAAASPRIVFLGDSLTAGYGLAASEAYPAIISRRLQERRLDYEVVNAGVSGDTSAGGVRRLDWSLQGEVRVLVIALGGNDGLRGLPPAELGRNLAAMIERAQARGVDVILAGMEAPPNFGASYTREFRAVYTDVARRHDVTLVPFLLEGVAGVPALNLPDGIHPNAEGQRRLADLVWRELEPMLASPATR
jgi:acyl-CoA thioesterase I